MGNQGSSHFTKVVNACRDEDRNAVDTESRLAMGSDGWPHTRILTCVLGRNKLLAGWLAGWLDAS